MDISIVVTTYNYAHFLESCLESCIEQYGHAMSAEIIVIDDGSTDHTGEVVALEKFKGIRFERIVNSGIEVAANYGCRIAQGDYLVRVDADDELLPNFLCETAKKLTGGSKDIIYYDYESFDARGHKIDDMKLPDFSYGEVVTRGDFLATGTVLKKSKFLAVGGYDESMKNSGLENFDLILRLLHSGAEAAHVAETTFRYRRHSENMSTVSRQRIIENGRALAQRHGLARYTTNKFHPYGLTLE